MSTTPVDRAKLREALTQAFSVNDLNAVCFDLGGDFESIEGSDLDAKVVGVIRYFERRGRIAELIDRCVAMRPKLATALMPDEATPAERAIGPLGEAAPALPGPTRPTVAFALGSIAAVIALGVALLARGSAGIVLGYVATAALVIANAVALALSFRAVKPHPRTNVDNPDRLNASPQGGAIGGLLGGVAAGVLVAVSYMREDAALGVSITLFGAVIGAAVGAWTHTAARRSRQASVLEHRSSLLMNDLVEVVAAALAGGDVGLIAGAIGGALFGPMKVDPPDPALVAAGVLIGAVCIVAGSLLISHRGAWARPLIAVAAAIVVGFALMALAVWAISTLGLLDRFSAKDELTPAEGALLGLPIGVIFGLGLGLQIGLALWFSRILDRRRFRNDDAQTADQ